MTRLKETVFTTQHKNPRQERAYYWGVYVNAASYNFKIGKEGKQGNAYGAGISVGYTAPLYGYRNNYIDLELGGSAGLLYTSYDVYTHDAESDCYPRIAEKCKSGHIVPFPLITDLRVAFVYRFMSAGSKYKESVYRRVQIRDFTRQALNEKINKMRERIDSINNAVRKQGLQPSGQPAYQRRAETMEADAARAQGTRFERSCRQTAQTGSRFSGHDNLAIHSLPSRKKPYARH